jgi:uncharacterized sodium:solute symporter family permease YidK
VFAAGAKLIMPFIIIMPGIMAFQLYGDQIANADTALPGAHPEYPARRAAGG